MKGENCNWSRGKKTALKWETKSSEEGKGKGNPKIEDGTHGELDEAERV